LEGTIPVTEPDMTSPFLLWNTVLLKWT